VRTATALLLAWTFLLSGCGESPSDDPVVDTDPDVITKPGDFGNGTGSSGPHIHDYWGGGDRVTVLDASHPGGGAEGTGPGFAGGEDVFIMAFQPESGDVVPQGTAAIEVTVTWVDATGDQYVSPELWMKTAGDNETLPVSPLVSGETLTFNVTAPQADLPHQLLSAWVFELRMSSADPMPLRFKGSVAVRAEAIRGLPLPVFPPHPDAWAGRAEIALLEASGSLSYFEDLQDHGCNGISCPRVLVPESGAIVPFNATRVLVTLTVDDAATAVHLEVHSALSRDFARVEPESDDGATMTYSIPVEGGGDGPYATQSQWEFVVKPDGTLPTEVAVGVEYTVAATVTRLP
jgi:hypothetical protein